MADHVSVPHRPENWDGVQAASVEGSLEQPPQHSCPVCARESSRRGVDTAHWKHRFPKFRVGCSGVEEQWLLGSISNSPVLSVSLDNNQGYHEEGATPSGCLLLCVDHFRMMARHNRLS